MFGSSYLPAIYPCEQIHLPWFRYQWVGYLYEQLT